MTLVGCIAVLFVVGISSGGATKIPLSSEFQESILSPLVESIPNKGTTLLNNDGVVGPSKSGISSLETLATIPGKQSGLLPASSEISSITSETKGKHGKLELPSVNLGLSESLLGVIPNGQAPSFSSNSEVSEQRKLGLGLTEGLGQGITQLTDTASSITAGITSPLVEASQGKELVPGLTLDNEASSSSVSNKESLSSQQEARQYPSFPSFEPPTLPPAPSYEPPTLPPAPSFEPPTLPPAPSFEPPTLPPAPSFEPPTLPPAPPAPQLPAIPPTPALPAIPPTPALPAIPPTPALPAIPPVPSLPNPNPPSAKRRTAVELQKELPSMTLQLVDGLTGTYRTEKGEYVRLYRTNFQRKSESRTSLPKPPPSNREGDSTSNGLPSNKGRRVPAQLMMPMLISPAPIPQLMRQRGNVVSPYVQAFLSANKETASGAVTSAVAPEKPGAPAKVEAEPSASAVSISEPIIKEKKSALNPDARQYYYGGYPYYGGYGHGGYSGYGYPYENYGYGYPGSYY